MKKVLSVSDTHGVNERWLKIIDLEKPDIILHSGDHCTEKNLWIISQRTGLLATMITLVMKLNVLWLKTCNLFYCMVISVDPVGITKDEKNAW